MIGVLQFLFPFAGMIEAERANSLTLFMLSMIGVKRAKKPNYPTLQQNIWGRDFLSPVGLSAGFDKNAKAVSGHFHLGFGFVELGTVTPNPQDGKPKPRVFKDKKTESVINRMGFPSAGVQKFGRNLGAFHMNFENHWGIVGANIGINADTKNPAEDFRIGMQNLGAMADYVVLNMSSPNTAGLRELQKPELFGPIIDTVMDEREKITDKLPAVVVKISPDIDMGDVPALAKLFLDKGVNGVIVTNTTITRPDVLADKFSAETGGLSGPLLQDKSTALVSAFYTHLKDKITIIGCGGINDAESAYAKIKAGAHLVQLYTALVFKGPKLVNQINKGLVDLLKKDGFENISDAVGSAHK
jgi:dihydroorotate dehydrogenase